MDLIEAVLAKEPLVEGSFTITKLPGRSTLNAMEPLLLARCVLMLYQGAKVEGPAMEDLNVFLGLAAVRLAESVKKKSEEKE